MAKIGEKTTNAAENLLKSQLKDSRNREKDLSRKLYKLSLYYFKQLDRDDLIKIMVKKKIIEKDWIRGSNKYKIRQDDKN